MLAMIAEELSAANRMYYGAHSKRGTPIPDQLHIPLPGAEPERKHSSMDEIKQFFGGLARPTGRRRRREPSGGT